MILSFIYLNHNSHTSLRHLELHDIRFEYVPRWGYQPGWALFGKDLDKQAMRTFYLSRIIFPEGEEAARCLSLGTSGVSMPGRIEKAGEAKLP